MGFFPTKTEKVNPDSRTAENGLCPTRGGKITVGTDVIGPDGNPEVFNYLTVAIGGTPGNAVVKGQDGYNFLVPIPEGGIAIARGVAVLASGNVSNGAGGTVSATTTATEIFWLGGS